MSEFVGSFVGICRSFLTIDRLDLTNHDQSPHIAMQQTFKLVLLALMIFVLAACGGTDDAAQTGSNAGSEVNAGTVFTQQGPIAAATVTVKSYDGQQVGATKSNAEGQYNLPSSLTGPFMAEAILPDGKKLYSVSLSSNMNINQLGDWIIRLWYQAKNQDVSTVFAGLKEGFQVPYVHELNVISNQMLLAAANALGEKSVELFGEKTTPALSKILKNSAIEGGEIIQIRLADVNFDGSFSLKSSVSKNGDVVFVGTEESTKGSGEPVKVRIGGSVGKTPGKQVMASSPMVRASGSGSNEHWMKDNWSYIKDRKLTEIVIPGTHDSGTNDIGVDGAGTARTQAKSVSDQLKDGIRYFDLRAVESKHWWGSCAEPSDWWIAHGGIGSPDSWTGGLTFYSYRVDTVLDEVKAFIAKPGNENEFVILDLQDTKDRYNDERAKNVLIGMILDKMSPYIIKSNSWKTYKLEDLQKGNKRILVLLENGVYERIEKFKFAEPAGCYGKPIDAINFSDRTKQLISLYDEDNAADAENIGKYTVDAQLNLSAAAKTGLDKRFKDYVAASAGLRVLQLVARPPNVWYAAPGYPLLDYAAFKVNAPLNYGDGDINCPSGWLGKRLRMGIEGSDVAWNPPNVIIADNYEYAGATSNKGYQWILPDYKNGKWVKGQASSYVDMIIALNKISRDDRRLKSVTDMQDGQCLQ